METLLGWLKHRHEELNRQKFGGSLMKVRIEAVDTMNNKTYSEYRPAEDLPAGLTSVIHFNANFLKMNERPRIEEALLHEMIHQWQDEVLYQVPGAQTLYTVPDVIGGGEMQQKPRPKDWHNRDFKDMAKHVGIPAKGDRCTGSPAKMPERKSYNRKFVCGCVASNGYPRTIWSTRPVNATCNDCGQDYIEVDKGGKVIEVKQSHIEKPGEDRVREEYGTRYENFERFRSKGDLQEFILTYEGDDGTVVSPKREQGTYQKGHNAYAEGFTHWLAFDTVQGVRPVPEPEPEPVKPEPKPAGGRRHLRKAELISLYRLHGNIAGIARAVGSSPAEVIHAAKREGVDFRTVLKDGGES